MGDFAVLFGDFVNWKYLILGVSILIFLHFSFRRKKLLNIYPSSKTHFFNVFGDLSKAKFNKYSYNGFSFTTAVLEIGEGLYKVFQNEHLFLIMLTYFPLIFLVTPEAIEDVMTNSKHCIRKAWFYNWTHCWLGKGLLTSTGKKWKSRRKLLTPAFHFDILKDFLPIIHEKSMKLIEKFKMETSNEFTNIVDPLVLCSLDVICETTLGVDIKAQENAESEYVKSVERVSQGIINRVKSILSWNDFTFFLTHGKPIKKDIRVLHNFTKSVIRDKKKQLMKSEMENNTTGKRRPLMEILLDHHLKTNELTEEDIREEVDTFAFAGHDTTAITMIWTTYLIGLYQDVQTKVHKEISRIFGDDTERPVTADDLRDMNYLECVIKETLRLYPAVPGIGRETDADITIQGYPIPKGTTIVISPFTLHRNEKIYPNPLIFDPERFAPENPENRRPPFAYMPFAAGPRNCIGQKLAMMEIKTVLANIIRNFHLKSLDARDKILPSFEITTRPSGPVRVKISSR